MRGEPSLNLDKAHIHAAEKDGPRYDPNMTEADRHSFANIILLCPPHHREIDGVNRGDYSPNLLKWWKADREGEGLLQLNGLRNLSEERLQEMISASQAMIVERFEEALNKFEELDFDTAFLLRVLIDELSEARVRQFNIDHDAIVLLSRSARMLSNLPDASDQLSRTAKTLRTLPETVETLSSATKSLANLRDSVSVLSNASKRLAGLGESAVTLQRAAKILESLNLIDAARDIRSAARALESAESRRRHR
ncbi:hypothetical protein [Planobispora rosea]|uniref:hypothetical protein n=1 Tax=Planobispora rosea TaxID=35762 RepID=UPI00114CDB38|nr:hypothetical protein [Planobispora rosea]